MPNKEMSKNRYGKMNMTVDIEDNLVEKHWCCYCKKKTQWKAIPVSAYNSAYTYICLECNKKPSVKEARKKKRKNK